MIDSWSEEPYLGTEHQQRNIVQVKQYNEFLSAKMEHQLKTGIPHNLQEHSMETVS